MSPARRLVVIGIPLLLVVVLLVVVGVRLLSGSGIATPAAPQDQPGPVLLVPGYGGNLDSLQPLAAALRAQGRTAVVVPLPGDGTGDLRESADAVDAAARQALAGGAASVDVVGYSAGGVVARLWVRDHTSEVRRVVTLGSPHHGTTLATAGALLSPGICPTACQQLVPGSSLLAELNEGDETPDGPGWTTVFTRDDQTVTPPQSGRLEGAVDVDLQALCPSLVVAHTQLPRDPTVTRIVEQALSAAPLTAPTAEVCVSS